jgi:predicted peptidase
MSPVVRGLVSGFALAAVVVGHVAAQAAPAQVVEQTTFTLSDGSTMRYGIAVPNGYERSGPPRPLVLALHPGGRDVYYGASFMRGIVEPALRSWGAVMIAPDVPDRSWSTAASDRAVLELVEHVMSEYTIDRTRVLVTGFSMGGGGTWYMASRHPEVFTGAIVMAGSAGDAAIAELRIPIYLIHSPDDDTVPFGPAEAAYRALAARGHAVEMRVLPGVSHYMMAAYTPPLRLAGNWMLERWAARP